MAAGTWESMVCRILPYEAADGPANMALDEALLDEVAADGRAAYLRCYGWAVPTLSLGYFQRLAEVQADPRWHRVPMVRRFTGGGAIWHHHEVTYALAVPAGHPRARPNTALYRAVHAAIAAILVDRGICAERRGDAGPRVAFRPQRPILCFTDRDPEDIVSLGSKLVGSAQRRRGGAVLQHGSVLLSRSPPVLELLGICDVADVSGSPESWSHQLLARIPAALDLVPEPIELGDALRSRGRELERATYRNPAWTGAR
jgi:lipoate-protein ligase A